jgi:hypothetical protein
MGSQFQMLGFYWAGFLCLMLAVYEADDRRALVVVACLNE